MKPMTTSNRSFCRVAIQCVVTNRALQAFEAFDALQCFRLRVLLRETRGHVVRMIQKIYDITNISWLELLGFVLLHHTSKAASSLAGS